MFKVIQLNDRLGSNCSYEPRVVSDDLLIVRQWIGAQAVILKLGSVACKYYDGPALVVMIVTERIKSEYNNELSRMEAFTSLNESSQDKSTWNIRFSRCKKN